MNNHAIAVNRPFANFSTAMLNRVAIRNPKGKLPVAVDVALDYELAVRRMAERREIRHVD